ncbi:holin [Brevibacterium sp.]|uniref:holin n=1 Tax=Brevibacterium sp. TaxID=1701 RepID=UPI00281225FA|nr:holin [Brevibacterium sp.]
MSNLVTREFWAATADRVAKTGAQSAITLIGAEAVNIVSLDWAEILGITATMMLLSVLSSIAGDVATKNGPSFTSSEGIGVANAEAEEALRMLRAGEDPVGAFDTRVSLAPLDYDETEDVTGPEDHDADEAEVVDLTDTEATPAEESDHAAEDADEVEAVDATEDTDPTPAAPGWTPKH